MSLAWQRGMSGKAVVCQEQITADVLRTMAEGSYIVTTCVVAAEDCKEGSRKPSLLGRKRYIEVATKLTKNNNYSKLNKLKREERFFELKILNN